MMFARAMGDWLVGQFTVFGIHSQNWMPLAAVILLAALVNAWIVERRRH
jgi:hypothetical protein